jgi:DNA-binding CsgD family transcriptional regulator/tetratricopeptide (TPR) repeat protein
MTALLERDDELRRLRLAFQGARAGRGQLVFVAGEAGVGKTTVINELLRGVSEESRVAVGRCDALATPRPLGPWLDIAAALAVVGDSNRDSLVGALLADLGQHGPSVVVIEDAHWADEVSLDVLVMLGRRVAELPVLLLVTYRDDEVSGDHPIRRVIGDVISATSTVWIGLSPLTRDAVQTLIDQTGVASEGLFELTGGNPFFVTEALASVGGAVPASARLAVLARASRLDGRARLVLDAASVVPGRAEAWLLAALSGQPESAVDVCVDAGVLLADRTTYSFRHELARLTIESDLSASRRRELNQRATVVLAMRKDVDPARVAHHAEASGDHAMLATSARLAFLSAVDRTAYREAARHGERALAVRQFLSPADVAHLQTKLAVALIALARSDEAVLLATEAGNHWQAVGDDHHQAEALIVLSAATASLGHTVQSMAPLAQAVAILERHPPGAELAAAYVRLATAHMLARQHDPAIEWGSRAIALATEGDDAALLGSALIITGIADVMDSRFDGLERVRRGIELGRRENLPGVVAQGLRQIGSGCGEMRRYHDAVLALEEGVAFTTTHNLETDRRYQLAWLARCRFDLGQWADVEAPAREALAGARTDAAARFVGLNTLGWLAARRGDGDVFAFLDEAAVFARETGHLQRLWPCAVARAEAGWLDGALDDHVAMLEDAFELAQQSNHRLAIGELALWLSRAGSPSVPGGAGPEPFAAWAAGDLMVASAGFRALGCPYELACVLAETGELASQREALATFVRLGASPMADRVEALLRDRGERVAARHVVKASSRHPSGLSDREVEVLRLVAVGFTNPQIATALFISRKTAEHHVSNILAKLGATTRTEAAAAAVRLGVAR